LKEVEVKEIAVSVIQSNSPQRSEKLMNEKSDK
jgi:hypothetical protein